MNGVRFPEMTGNFSFRHRVQTGSGAHPTSYQVITRGKTARAWNCPLTSTQRRD